MRVRTIYWNENEQKVSTELFMIDSVSRMPQNGAMRCIGKLTSHWRGMHVRRREKKKTHICRYPKPNASDR